MYNRQEPKPSQEYNDDNYCLIYGAHSNSGNYRQQGVKRPYGGDGWQTPKRFNAPQVNPWGDDPQEHYAPRNTFQPFQARQPRYQPPVARSRPPGPLPNNSGYRPPNTTPYSNFQPANKVTNLSAQSPKKFDTCTIQKDEELITKPIKKKKKPLDSDHVLQADVTPPYPVKGRLEMSLGAIFVVHKNDHRDNPADFAMFYKIQKVLKEILRARIRSVMLGHQVGPVVDIVARYRCKYPRETDEELIAMAQEAHLRYDGVTKELLEEGISQLVS